MSNPFKNLLDLRTKEEKEVVIVEKIILKKRSLWSESLRTLAVIAIVSTIVYGISHADTLFTDGFEQAKLNFSAIGTVSEITDNSITLIDAKGSDTTGNTTYTLNISHLDKIETSSYIPLIITDIKTGDKVIAQGLTDGSTFFIKRLVSFSVTESSQPTTATSTATTTLDVATTTEEVATTTSTTTPDVATTTDEVATTTEPTVTEPTPTTTPDVASSTESTTTESATTTPSIIENVIETVKEIVQTVVDAVTPDAPATTE